MLEANRIICGAAEEVLKTLPDEALNKLAGCPNLERRWGVLAIMQGKRGGTTLEQEIGLEWELDALNKLC